MIKILLTAFFLNIFFAAALAAEVNPIIIYKYYNVNENAKLSLREQLLQDTPLESKTIDNPTGKAFGNAYCSISYKLSAKSYTEDLCEGSDFEVSCKCEINLPKMITFNQKIQDNSDAYFDLIKNHELEHCNIAVRYANLFEKEVKELSARPCGQMASAIKPLFQKITQEVNTAQSEFDELFNKNRPKAERKLLRFKLKNKKDKQSSPQNDGEIYKDHNGVWRNF